MWKGFMQNSVPHLILKQLARKGGDASRERRQQNSVI